MVIQSLMKMSPFDMRGQIELKYGMYATLGGVLLFAGINKLVKILGPPKNLKNPEKNEPKWRNTYVSYLHAILISGWSIGSTVMYPELVYDLIGHINYVTYYCVCVTTGYFTYDLLDNIVNGLFISNWEVSLHHIANLSVFYCNVFLKQNIGFNILALYLEVNSIFLHWRKLLQMDRVPFSSRKYIAIKHLNIMSVVLFRFPATFLITWAAYAFHDRVPQFLATLVFIACPFMHILNSVVLYRLVKSDLLRGPDGSPCSIMDTYRRDWLILTKETSGLLDETNSGINGDFPNNNDLSNGKSIGLPTANGTDVHETSNGHPKSS